MRAAFVATKKGQIAGVAVVVREVEVMIERQRVSYHLIMRLVAGARRRAVRDKPPQHEKDDGRQPPRASPSSFLRSVLRNGHDGQYHARILAKGV
jgi:hypothetical protein